MASRSVYAGCTAIGLILLAPALQAQNLQATYDKAQAAFDANDMTGAAAGFSQVAGSLDVPPRSTSQAVIRSRLATAYHAIGRNAEAERAARSALERLTDKDGLEVAAAWLVIGDVQRLDLELADAAASYTKAKTLAPQGTDVEFAASIGLAMATMVTEPGRAAVTMDGILSNSTLLAKVPAKTLAQLEMLRGRAALNQGETAKALVFLDKALKDSGGVRGSMIDNVQIPVRGDTAIANELLGHHDRARELLTWTGAGHLKDDRWISMGSIEPPVCSDIGDLRPDDTAVIEFAIGDDGHVISALPIYAKRSGENGVLFAQAVRDWHWSPDQLKVLNSFWRSNVRVQLRCVTRPAPLQLSKQFLASTAQWLRSIGDSEQAAAAIDRPAARRPEGDTSGIAEMIAEQLRTGKPLSDAKEAALDRALDSANAPADVRAVIVYARARGLSGLAAEMAKIEPRFGASRGFAWLRLEHALELEGRGSFGPALTELTELLGTDRSILPNGDAVRQVAALHADALAKRAGRSAEVAPLVQQAQISTAECSLIDLQPTALNAQISSSQFPGEALRWGFEGYVREAFDIAGDGRAIGVRTVIAYPPFVFGGSTEQAVSRFRYIPPSIDGKPVSCSGNIVNVRYLFPGR